MEEQWKQIPIARNYAVSTLGRVKRIVAGQGAISEKILNQIDFTVAGYKRVRLSQNGKVIRCAIHRLVAITFLGLPEDKKLMVCHNDGDKLNNRLSNLRWGTCAENQRDKVIHGNSLKGEKHPNSKLSDDSVRYIRSSKESKKELAIKFSVSQMSIRRVLKRKIWDHVI